MNKDALPLATAALACWLMACTLGPSDPDDRKVASARTSATSPIRSQLQLDAYLKAHARTPLDGLSPGARERFLLSLRFGGKGLGGFDPTDLAEELTQQQIRDVMAMFGEDMEAYAPESRLADPPGPATKPIADNRGMSAVEKRYNLFYRTDRDARNLDDRAYEAAIAERFDALFAETRDAAKLKRSDDHDLQLLSRAAETTAMTSLQPRHVDAFRNTLQERDRRRQATASDVETMQRLLLATHRYDDAKRLSEDYPDAHLAPLPIFRDSLGASGDRATVWELDGNGTHLTRAVVDLAPTQVWVTASCHFSQDAAQDISADPVLAPVFKRHARWMTLPPGSERIDLARDWNRRFPNAQVAMAYDQREWPMLPSWETPVFYIIRDGRVIDSVIGWTRNPAESRQPLIDALSRAGLLTATDAAGESAARSK